ncbi:MAG: transporter substrate-binding domain-containing protein [Caldilineaceae bacterium]
MRSNIFRAILLQDFFGPPPIPNRSEASTAAIVVERGVLRVGIRQDSQPFGFIDENGTLSGFDIDLAHEIARRWLGDGSAVEFIAVSLADRIPRLAAGDVDLLLAAMPYKQERDAFIDFSQPYFVDGQVLLVSAESDIGSWDDLNDKVIAVVKVRPHSKPWKNGRSVGPCASDHHLRSVCTGIFGANCRRSRCHHW